MGSVNKADMVNKLAEKLDITKVDAEKFLTTYNETVIEEVSAGNSVRLSGFASFEPAVQKARTVHNPSNPDGPKIDVPEKKVIKIRPYGRFKEAVAGN